MLKLMRQAVATARLMVGVKDYDAYVARRRRFNPDAPVMTRDEFFRACQEARFGKGNSRCPC